MVSANEVLLWQQIHEIGHLSYTGGYRIGNLFPYQITKPRYPGCLILGGINSRHDGNGKITAEHSIRDINYLLDEMEQIAGRPVHMNLTHKPNILPVSGAEKALWNEFFASKSMFATAEMLGRYPDFRNTSDKPEIMDFCIATYPGEEDDCLDLVHRTNAELGFISPIVANVSRFVQSYIEAGMPLTIVTTSFGAAIAEQIRRDCHAAYANPSNGEGMSVVSIQNKKFDGVVQISLSPDVNWPNDNTPQFYTTIAQFANDRRAEESGNNAYNAYVSERIKERSVEELLRDQILVLSRVGHRRYALTGIAIGVTGEYPHAMRDLIDPQSGASPGMKIAYQGLIRSAVNRTGWSFDPLGAMRYHLSALLDKEGARNISDALLYVETPPKGILHSGGGFPPGRPPVVRPAFRRDIRHR